MRIKKLTPHTVRQVEYVVSRGVRIDEFLDEHLTGRSHEIRLSNEFRLISRSPDLMPPTHGLPFIHQLIDYFEMTLPEDVKALYVTAHGEFEDCDPRAIGLAEIINRSNHSAKDCGQVGNERDLMLHLSCQQSIPDFRGEFSRDTTTGPTIRRVVLHSAS
jgi:hypothetical protein